METGQDQVVNLVSAIFYRSDINAFYTVHHEGQRNFPTYEYSEGKSFKPGYLILENGQTLIGVNKSFKDAVLEKENSMTRKNSECALIIACMLNNVYPLSFVKILEEEVKPSSIKLSGYPPIKQIFYFIDKYLVPDPFSFEKNTFGGFMDKEKYSHKWSTPDQLLFNNPLLDIYNVRLWPPHVKAAKKILALNLFSKENS